MGIKIGDRKDFYAGILFIFFGILAIIMSLAYYPMGSAARMGPGYFPFLTGGCLTLIGLAAVFRALRVRGESIKGWEIRPLILVLGGILAFALMIQPLGLVIASLALIVITCLGGWEFKVIEVTILYLVLTAVAVGLFIYGIGLPINVWPK